MGNADEARLWGELRSGGVDVIDPMPLPAGGGEPVRFLSQDTHWTPAWMQEVAAQVAAQVGRSLVGGSSSRSWRRTPAQATRVGDLVDMLRLTSNQGLFAPQSVPLLRVEDEAGKPFAPARTAEVLLLGDSFTNIFTLPSMGWGEAAGFAPQLAAALGRDVDVIAQNDAGAHATRELLSRELAAGRDRLAGKRVVIWQFAARELVVGDWRPVHWPPAAGPQAGPESNGRFLTLSPGETLSVSAEVIAASPVPRPADVPYKDHVRALHLRLPPAATGGADRESLAYVYSMRDNRLVAGAALVAGARIKVRLRRWSEVAYQIDGVNRSELDDPALLEAEPTWTELP